MIGPSGYSRGWNPTNLCTSLVILRISEKDSAMEKIVWFIMKRISDEIKSKWIVSGELSNERF